MRNDKKEGTKAKAGTSRKAGMYIVMGHKITGKGLCVKATYSFSSSRKNKIRQLGGMSCVFTNRKLGMTFKAASVHLDWVTEPHHEPLQVVIKICI